jgi:hypothetical protein
MSRHKTFAEELLSVRPTTRNLVTSILMDVWPNHAAIVDFGIDSQKHYEALYYPVREAEIMPKELDAALGHGEKLTAMTREAASNPHKDVEFHTSWDVVLGRETERVGPKMALNELRNDASRAPAPEASKERDRTLER